MVDTFEQLKIAASRLNTASDQLSKNLGDIETKLNALNIGLEVCLENDPLKISDEDIDRNSGEKIWTETQLGYGKTYLGEWGLVVSNVTYRSKGDDDFDIIGTSSPTSLSQASRDLRLEAAKHIEKLYKALLRAAEEKIKNADAAQKLAAQL